MITKEDIKLIRTILDGNDEIDIKELNILKEKIGLLCEQIDVQDEMNDKLLLIQDKLKEVYEKSDKNENEEEK